jgi:hypothetical protein
MVINVASIIPNGRLYTIIIGKKLIIRAETRLKGTFFSNNGLIINNILLIKNMTKKKKKVMENVNKNSFKTYLVIIFNFTLLNIIQSAVVKFIKQKAILNLKG